jgi:hypothetical protein
MALLTNLRLFVYALRQFSKRLDPFFYALLGHCPLAYPLTHCRWADIPNSTLPMVYYDHRLRWHCKGDMQ